MYFGKRPPAYTLPFMQPAFRRINRTRESEPKADRCSYLNRGRNHTRDCVKVVTSSGQTSNTRDVTWEVERMPIIAAAPNTGATTGPETWDAELHVRYVSPVSPVPPVLPDPPVLPVTPQDLSLIHI